MAKFDQAQSVCLKVESDIMNVFSLMQDDVAYQQKKRDEQKALKEAKDRACKKGPMGMCIYSNKQQQNMWHNLKITISPYCRFLSLSIISNMDHIDIDTWKTWKVLSCSDFALKQLKRVDSIKLAS